LLKGDTYGLDILFQYINRVIKSRYLWIECSDYKENSRG